MAKTYGTVVTFTAGSVLTATQMNTIGTAVNNLVVPPACRAYRAAVQSIGNANWTCVNFDTKDFDTDSMFTASSTSITINTAGIYQISANVLFASNATGARICGIVKNPTVAGSGDAVTIANVDANLVADVQVSALSGAQTNLSVTTAVSLAANDVIRFAIYQGSGGALNIGDASRTFCTNMSVCWIGRTS